MSDTNGVGLFPIFSEQACARCPHKPCRTMVIHAATAMAFASAEIPYQCPFRVVDVAVLECLEKEILNNMGRRQPHWAAFRSLPSGSFTGGHAGGQRMERWLRMRSLTVLWLRFGSSDTTRLRSWEEAKRKAFRKQVEKAAEANPKEWVPMFEDDDDLSLGVALELDEPLSLSIAMEVDHPLSLSTAMDVDEPFLIFTAADADEPVTLHAGVEDA